MRVRSSRRRLAWGGGVLCLLFLMLAASASATLPDKRSWEMVSPPDKNGGEIEAPETIAGGGALQAASQGGLVTFSSTASFAGGQGAPIGSQYLSGRSASGWSTQNISTPLFSGSYDLTDQGVPWRLFSENLSRALLLNGDRCRGEAGECPVVNPPLPGTDAPPGFQDYYLFEGGSFEALIGAADIAGRGLDPSTFEVKLQGATPGLGAVVLASCAALTDDAIDGCATGASNLYLWRKATGSLTLLATPGSRLAAQAGALAQEGNRVYLEGIEDGPLVLREGANAYPVSAGAASFQAASGDGSVAYYLEAAHLYRYLTVTHTATDITPTGGVKGVLGASADGSAVYFQGEAGLQRWSEGTTTTVAPGAAAADPSAWPAPTGAARVSADGAKLLFPSKEKLSGYDNTDKVSGEPDSELFLYDAGTATLKCLSCNPVASRRPRGPSSIPGAIANGVSFAAYKPRVLSANGKRVFFDSADTLSSADANSDATTGEGIPDVYEWEAQGEGSCAKAGGCLEIISGGAFPQGASFVDASADGTDAYFLTAASLLPGDFGAADLYDARAGGGFPEASPQVPCEGDACQLLPAIPEEPTLATLEAGLGNPPLAYRKYCRKGYVKRKGICEKKGARHHRKRHHKHKHRGGGR